MRVIVFGATGKTGRHVSRLALDRGHEVTAFGRSADRLDPEPGLSASKGDVLEPGAVATAVEGHDGAIVCLGSTGLRDSTTLAAGTANIVAAVDSHGVGRLVVLSAAGVGDSWTQIPWSSRLMFKTMLRNILADHRAQEAVVEGSKADWTVVRSAVLTDKPATGTVTATKTGPTKRISRTDVAGYLVDQLTDASLARRAISVTT
ncbi:MAG: SDR family oxidoreductase [Acidimicrobiaceae bacterium]|nr:SDR family oxidoreductase [Acidimicrobiaceae bacterium]MXW99281.1 SDR family oxidoreductase [Acidimicrobiaceae bacterium]MYH92627.1 SDR family oxidoreductase [Acidimicrobiaceae bacterium]